MIDSLNITNHDCHPETPHASSSRVLNFIKRIVDFFIPELELQAENALTLSQIRVTICCLFVAIFGLLAESAIYYHGGSLSVSLTQITCVLLLSSLLIIHKKTGRTTEVALILWGVIIISHTLTVVILHNAIDQLVWWGIFPLGIIIMFNRPRTIIALSFITMLTLLLQVKLFPPPDGIFIDHNATLTTAMMVYALTTTAFVMVKRTLIVELQTALDNVKILRGLLPICANCKSIRNSRGYYEHVEEYIQRHTNTNFSHTLCPTCIQTLYPEYVDEIENEREELLKRAAEECPECLSR